MTLLLNIPWVLLVTALGLSLHTGSAFSPPASTQNNGVFRYRGSVAEPRNPSVTRRANQKPMADNDNDDDDEEDDPERITRDQFYRDLMGHSETAAESEETIQNEPQQNSSKRKGKNQKYGNAKRPHDNRDSLPFLVQVMTPPEEPYEQGIKKTKKQKRKGSKGDSKDDNLGIVGETLGEFAFEKNTGAGDKIEIDHQIYLVQRATCQYRYAGAQKFVMVRKILQVKPMQRAMQEDYLLRQWNAAPAPESE